MPTTYANNAGNSGAEERFIQLFCDVFGPEKGQYVYLQYPFIDIHGNPRDDNLKAEQHRNGNKSVEQGNAYVLKRTCGKVGYQCRNYELADFHFTQLALAGKAHGNEYGEI